MGSQGSRPIHQPGSQGGDGVGAFVQGDQHPVRGVLSGVIVPLGDCWCTAGRRVGLELLIDLVSLQFLYSARAWP